MSKVRFVLLAAMLLTAVAEFGMPALDAATRPAAPVIINAGVGANGPTKVAACYWWMHYPCALGPSGNVARSDAAGSTAPVIINTAAGIPIDNFSKIVVLGANGVDGKGWSIGNAAGVGAVERVGDNNDPTKKLVVLGDNNDPTKKIVVLGDNNINGKGWVVGDV